MTGAVLARMNDDARQTVFALNNGSIVLLWLHAQKQRSGPMGNNFLPIIPARRLHGCTHQLEINSAIQIGENVELVVPVGDIVLIVGFARGDETRGWIGFFYWEPVDFRRRMA